MVAPTIEDCLSLTRELLSPLFVRCVRRTHIKGIEEMIMESPAAAEEEKEEEARCHAPEKRGGSEATRKASTLPARAEDKRGVCGADGPVFPDCFSFPSRSLFFSSMVDFSSAAASWRSGREPSGAGWCTGRMPLSAALQGALDPMDWTENEYFFYPPHRSVLAWRETSFVLHLPNALRADHCGMGKRVGSGERRAAAVAHCDGPLSPPNGVSAFSANAEATNDARVVDRLPVKEEEEAEGPVEDGHACRTPLFGWFHHVACRTTPSHTERALEGENEAAIHPSWPSTSSPPSSLQTTPFALLLRAFLLLSRWYRLCGNLAAALDVLHHGGKRLQACFPATQSPERCAAPAACSGMPSWKEEKKRLVQELKDRLGGVYRLGSDGTSASPIPSIIRHAHKEGTGEKQHTTLWSLCGWEDLCEKELETVLDGFWRQEGWYAHLLWHSEYCAVLYAMLRWLSSPIASVQAPSDTASTPSRSRPMVEHLKRARDRHTCLSQLLTHSSMCIAVDEEFQQWDRRWTFGSPVAPETEKGKATPPPPPGGNPPDPLERRENNTRHRGQAVSTRWTATLIDRSTLSIPLWKVFPDVSPRHSAERHTKGDVEDRSPPPSHIHPLAQRQGLDAARVDDCVVTKESMQEAAYERERCACVSSSSSPWSPLLLLLPFEAPLESNAPCEKGEEEAEKKTKEVGHTPSRASPSIPTTTASCPAHPPHTKTDFPPSAAVPRMPSFGLPLRGHLHPSCLIAWHSSLSPSGTLGGEASVDILPFLRLLTFLYAFASALSSGSARRGGPLAAEPRSRNRPPRRAHAPLSSMETISSVEWTLTRCGAIGRRAADGYRKRLWSPVRQKREEEEGIAQTVPRRRLETTCATMEEEAAPVLLAASHRQHPDGGRDERAADRHPHPTGVRSPSETDDEVWEEFSIFHRFFLRSSLAQAGGWEGMSDAVTEAVPPPWRQKDDAGGGAPPLASVPGLPTSPLHGVASSAADEDGGEREGMEATWAVPTGPVSSAALTGKTSGTAPPRHASSSSVSLASRTEEGTFPSFLSSLDLLSSVSGRQVHWTTARWRQLMQAYDAFCTLAAIPAPPPVVQPFSPTNAGEEATGASFSALLARYTAVVQQVEREIQRVVWRASGEAPGKDGVLASSTSCSDPGRPLLRTAPFLWTLHCASAASPSPSPHPWRRHARRPLDDREKGGESPFRLPIASSLSFLRTLQAAAHLTMATTALRQRYPLQCVRCLAAWRQCVDATAVGCTAMKVWGHLLIALLALQMGVVDVPAADPFPSPPRAAAFSSSFGCGGRGEREGEASKGGRRTTLAGGSERRSTPPSVVRCFHAKARRREGEGPRTWDSVVGETSAQRSRPSPMPYGGVWREAHPWDRPFASRAPWVEGRTATDMEDWTMGYRLERNEEEEEEEEEVEESEIAAMVGLSYYHLLMAEALATGEERDVLTPGASFRERDGSASGWEEGSACGRRGGAERTTTQFPASAMSCGPPPPLPPTPPSLVTSSPSFVLQLQLLKLFAIYVTASGSRSRVTIGSAAVPPTATETVKRTREWEETAPPQHPSLSSIPDSLFSSSLAPTDAPSPSILLQSGPLEVTAHAPFDTQKHCQRICRIKLHHLLDEMRETCWHEAEDARDPTRQRHEADEEQRRPFVFFSVPDARSRRGSGGARTAATPPPPHGRIPAEAWTTDNRSLLLLIHGLFAATEEQDPFLAKKQWKRAMCILESQKGRRGGNKGFPTQEHSCMATATKPLVRATHTSIRSTVSSTRTPWEGEMKVLLSHVSQEMEEMEERRKKEIPLPTEEESIVRTSDGLLSMGKEESGARHAHGRGKNENSPSRMEVADGHSGMGPTPMGTTRRRANGSGAEADGTEEMVEGEDDKEAIAPMQPSRHQEDITNEENEQKMYHTAIGVASGARLEDALSSHTRYPPENVEEAWKACQRLSFSAPSTFPSSLKSTSRHRGSAESDEEGIENGRPSALCSTWKVKHHTSRIQEWDALPPSAATRRWRQEVFYLCAGHMPAPPSSRLTGVPYNPSTTLPHPNSPLTVPPTVAPSPSSFAPPSDLSTLTADASFSSLAEADAHLLHDVFAYLPL